MLPDGVKVRDYNPDTDLNYITDSWRRSYRFSHYSGTLLEKEYVKAYNATIHYLLDKPTTRIKVVCAVENPELGLDESDIFGYIIYDPDMREKCVIHYMYIKEPYREKGFGKHILTEVLGEQKFFDYTFRTRSCKLLHKRYNANFRPDLVNEKSSKKPFKGDSNRC